MRIAAALFICWAASACGSPPCLKRCAPQTEIAVVGADGSPLSSFRGSATLGGEAFLVDCSPTAAPYAASSPDGGAMRVAGCEGSTLRLDGSGSDVSLELTSDGLSFTGVVTTAFEPSDTDGDSCSGGCGRNIGRVELR